MNQYRVTPRSRVRLQGHDPNDTGAYRASEEVAGRVTQLKRRLEILQERLYAEGTRAVLVVLQGIDTAGKDGTIRHVMGGLNPQGCIVASFKGPTDLEERHDFLWRVHASCPPHGYIGIFNRSHYEDVLITRVHGRLSDAQATRRFGEIRAFEALLAESGTRVLKFFLHISKEEQKTRLLARVDEPDKRWKISAQDLKERRYWKAYTAAFEEGLAATSTRDAPWFIVPANHKWYRDLVVADRLVHALEDMDPRPPRRKGVNWTKLRKAVLKS